MSVRVAYYSPLPPSRSGIADYSALLLPALAERVEVAVARPGPVPPRRRSADVASTTSATTRPSTAGSSRRCAAAPGWSCCTSSCSTTSSPGSRSRAATSRATSPRLERDAGLVGRPARPRGRRRADRAAVGDAGAGLPARPRGARPGHRSLIVHSALRRGARPRGRLSRSRCWRIPMPAWPVPDVEPAAVDGGPVHRLLRARQREQARPAAPARRSPGCAAPPGRTPAARRVARRRGCPALELPRRA